MAKLASLGCALALCGSLVEACDPDVYLGSMGSAGTAGSSGERAHGGGSGASGARANGGGAGAGGTVSSGGGGAAGAGEQDPIWRSDFEVGDLSEWTGDGNGGSYRSGDSSVPTVVSERAHTGTQSLKLTISVANGMSNVNYVYRQAPTPTEAYYTAWFFLPKNYTVKDWLNIVHFVGSETGDGRNEVSLWDLGLRSASDGTLALYAYEFDGSKEYNPAVARPFPVGAWVKIEVLFRKASDASGRVAVFQDGVSLLDVTNVRTAPNDWLRWAIGNASANIVPSPADLYVDDASISLTRVAP